MSSKRDKAIEYFDLGYNCSQAVLAAFSDELGIAENEALETAYEFGGGMGNHEVCGAVTGAIMVLKLKYKDIKSSVEVEKIVNDFRENFKLKNNAINCSELLGYDIRDGEDLKKILEENLFKTVCPKMVSDAAEILEQMKK